MQDDLADAHAVAEGHAQRAQRMQQIAQANAEQYKQVSCLGVPACLHAAQLAYLIILHAEQCMRACMTDGEASLSSVSCACHQYDSSHGLAADHHAVSLSTTDMQLLHVELQPTTCRICTVSSHQPWK